MSARSVAHFLSLDQVAVPMPRGSVCVLLPDGWAGSKVKHAIRPQDMEGKSGVVLLRHVHENLIRSGDELKLSDLADLFAAASLQDGPWCAPAPRVSAHAHADAHAVVARAPTLPDPLQLAEEAGLAPLAHRRGARPCRGGQMPPQRACQGFAQPLAPACL